MAAAVAIGILAWREILPFGLAMPPLDGKASIDPHAPIVVKGMGLGTRLTSVELREETGKIVAQTANQPQITLTSPLAFGTRYTLAATAERPWFGQRETRELAFATADIPQLEGPAQRILAPDASLTLRFDRPIGRLQTTGNLKLEIQPDDIRQTFRLTASNYAQGQTYPVELDWQTSTGVPLPPLRLEITTPPSLSAEINTSGLSNLGLGLPLQITFSEPLANRNGASRHIKVRTEDKEIAGKWQWINKRRLQFTPQPNWPASSAIQVSIDPAGPKSLRGGFLDHGLNTTFSTGPDRRIAVYLDTQQAAAIENDQVVRTFAVSTGKAATPTVTGTFYIYARFPVKTMRSRAKRGQKGHYVVEDVPYAQYFYEDYAFHGAWWHNSFGRPASHGCVNLSTRKNNRRWPEAAEDAGWLYQWASLGVPVSVLPHAPTQVAMQ
jgi:lipoprotein-anchoring transpeptidase ErfK/SrfK